MNFYRYKITKAAHTPLVVLDKYSLKRETPKGYWIGYSWTEFGKKWVHKKSKKRFAYPTKEEAMVNFIKRTEKRIGYLERDLELCKLALLSKDVSMYDCDTCKHFPCIPGLKKVSKGQCGDYDSK